jgi:ADP-heptose:LPS heptosyltransferase
MPEDETEFHQSFMVLKFLDETKKNSYIFTHDFRVSLIPTKFRPHVIEHTIGETNRLNLATHKLIEKLKEKKFQAVIDLNIKDNIFFSHIISSIDVPMRIGFKKNNSDKYYNIQINPEDSKPEISYKNLVNCLNMF